MYEIALAGFVEGDDSRKFHHVSFIGHERTFDDAYELAAKCAEIIHAAGVPTKGYDGDFVCIVHCDEQVGAFECIPCRPVVWYDRDECNQPYSEMAK